MNCFLNNTVTQNQIQLPLLDHIQKLPAAWQAVLLQEQNTLTHIEEALNTLISQGITVFPTNPFNALLLTAPTDAKVIIIGQDPYHTPNLAQGLAFSVPNQCKRPPSLRNIFTELQRQYPDELSSNANDLTHWAQQGVLLMNAVLTVEQGKAASHSHLGWQKITDRIIKHVASLETPKVFMLWGSFAQQKEDLINQSSLNKNHLILKANHPSPLSALRPPIPFIGCGHFESANQWLNQKGEHSINWLQR